MSSYRNARVFYIFRRQIINFGLREKLLVFKVGKIVLWFVLLLLLCSVMTSLSEIKMVNAGGTIYIRADGNVEGTDKITRDGSIYTFTSDLFGSVIVERDNIVIEGAGYTLQGTGALLSKGIDVSNRSNVMVRNVKIRAFHCGICIYDSSNNTLSNIYIANTTYGVELWESENNILSGNNIKASIGVLLHSSKTNIISNNYITTTKEGVFLEQKSDNNIISGNYIANNQGSGIHLGGSLNQIIGNYMANNGYGIYIFSPPFMAASSNNLIYNNSFVNNAVQVFIEKGFAMADSINLWDNGKEGNYWSDYNGTDADGDGIGDTPYIIDENNQDRFPLMSPFGPQNSALSYPLVAMPEEYINYTICFVDGRVWAKVDGTYHMQKIFGAGEEFCIDGIRYVVLSNELPLLYPTPPGTTNISIKIDGAELPWSNYTEANPQALHSTVLGSWPIIYCKINDTPDRFTLKIHYEHPVEIVNGSHIFLYDLNISPYLTPWNPKSTAFFSIRMEVRYTNLSIYTTGTDGVWRPVNYLLVNEDAADVISFQIVSQYSKPLHGDIAVKFAVIETSDQQTKYFWVALATIIIAVASVYYVVLQHKKVWRRRQTK